MSVRIAVIGVGALGKHHARILADLPDAELVGIVDINEARARAIAHNWAGCHETLRVCEIRGKPENETWVYEIDFVKFADKSAEDWTRMFGLKRVVVGRKGQIVETAWWGNNGSGPN